MKLGFEDDKRYYDGNISYQNWKTPFVAKNQQYKHEYDGASRLTKSLYSGGASGSNYSLDSIVYDPNGNIQLLKRHTIDNLSYTYNGNQLLSVSDAGTTAGFNDGNTTGNDYGYWANGALKFDKNKGIDSIVYNSYLKKVSRVKFSSGDWINFYYNGVGTLLKRKLSSGETWVYRDDLLVKNDTTYYFNHDEGRTYYDKTTQKWVSEFEYRDHLSNLRISFRDSLASPVNGVYAPPVVTQIHETDAFGLQIDAISYENAGNNNWKFQNQEKIEDFGLNLNWFKFRPFDGETGRGWQIDRLADKYVHNSPYAFSENKVTGHVELDGLEAVRIDALQSPKVQHHVKKATEAGKEILSFSGGVTVGGVGIDAKAGKAKVTIEASFAEAEVTKTRNGVQTEVKALSVNSMIGTDNAGVGGEINVVNIQAGSGQKENVQFFRAAGKGALGNGEVNTDDGKSATAEVGLSFLGVTGKVKASFDKTKEYISESISAFGAYLTEIFNTDTNQTFTGKTNKKHEK
jgi:hypothetical protein